MIEAELIEWLFQRALERNKKTHPNLTIAELFEKSLQETWDCAETIL